MLFLSACSGSPAGRDDPALEVRLFEALSPDTAFSCSASDSDEFTRRIADTAAKIFSSREASGAVVELQLHTQIRQWEDKSPGFLTKRYEIYLKGLLTDQDSRRIGVLEGWLEYRRGRFRLAVSDEARQYDVWDRDFIDWGAGKIAEALTF